MATGTDAASAEARVGMVARLRREGWLRSAEWIAAFGAVPREVFVRRFFGRTTEGWVAVGDGDPDWLAAAYSVDSLVTQLDGDDARWFAARREPQRGTPTSSSSDPGLMASMLEALEVRDGGRVLEVGTGTGYNAALLCHRLGSGRVTSVEVDAGLAEAARVRLAGLGYTPTVVTGDGVEGVPERAPYDRIIATVAAPRVPAAWLAQARPGGMILLNLYSELGGGALLLLTVDGPHRAEGHFLPSFGAFMPLRAAMPATTDQDRLRTALHSADGTISTTDVPADVIGHPDAGMLIGLLVKDVARIGFTPAGGTEQLWLLADDGSWAMRHADTAEQSGPRRLWDEVSAAYELWDRLGRPSRDRFGVTVTADQQVLWLDAPGRRVTL
jgi:methyltransferase of ATP-grasp peptide maturase system